MEKQFIGCDPGKEGAIVVLQGGEVTKYLYPMIGSEYDIHEMMKIFSKFDKSNCHVVIEDVTAIPGGSAKANWSFSRGKAILEVLAISFDLPFTMVRPMAWQKVLHQGIPKMAKPKDMTLMAVKRLYPTVDLRSSSRATNPHEGIFDALALAHYCKQTFNN